MTYRLGWFTLLVFTLLLLPGCEAAMAIFEAGWWVGMVVAAVVIGLVVLLVSRMKR